MRKVVIHIAMSLDGFVADKNGDVSFLQGDGSDSDNMGTFGDFYDTVGDVIMGYSTYHQVVTELAPDNYPYIGKKSYVFTSKKLENTDDVFFTDENIVDVISSLKSNNDKGCIWINGGASIVNQVLVNNLADELIVSIIPTILGDGIRLFAQNDTETKLKVIESSVFNGITEIRYSFR